MKVPFYEYSKVEKDIEISEEDLKLLSKVARKQFLNHIEFSSSYNSPAESPLFCLGHEKLIWEFCQKNGINLSSKEDRMAFFSALLDRLELKPL